MELEVRGCIILITTLQTRNRRIDRQYTNKTGPSNICANQERAVRSRLWKSQGFTGKGWKREKMES